MRFNILIILLLNILFNQMIAAQCAEPDVSIWENTWRSCEAAINPNPNRDVGQWIMYDLGSVYSLTTTRIWNNNELGELDQGFNQAIVDYSEDGNVWNTLGEFVFPMANGEAIYNGFEGPNFEGKLVQYVLISAMSNWGDPSCYGLAEVKFNLISDTLTLPEVIDDCLNPPCDSTSLCNAPSTTEVSHLNANEVLILWPEQENTLGYNFQYRKEGDTTWIAIPLEESEAFLSMLETETTYEYQIQAICEGEFSEFSTTFTFTTIPEMTECGLPFSTSAFVHEGTFATLSWNEVPEAMMYEIRYRKVGGSSDWITASGTDIFQDLEDLEPESEYRYQIRVQCPNGWTNFSPFYYFDTPEAELVSIFEVEKEKERFWLYPNPADDYTSIRYHSSTLETVDIQIFNAVGQSFNNLTFDANIGINNFILPLNNLGNGAYIVRLVGDDTRNRIAKQLIVMRKE